jgi:uncharacterized membrane protein
MTGRLARNWGFVAAALAIAVAVHVASVLLLPRWIMDTAIARIARAGGMNAMAHGERATAKSRAVVRPSPDLLYSSCPFDLAQAPHGALRVRASGMPDTYWSVSVFDAETNNVYVLDDRQAKGEGERGTVDFTLVRAGSFHGPGAVEVPTTRGLVLFRTLIDNETRLAEIDAGRRHATCEGI